MRAVLQRVSEASVEINGKLHGAIEYGFLVLLGIETTDSKEDMDWICKKIVGMRVFADEEGKMNVSINDVTGGILVISQFTLHASTRKGNRPSFIKAARPEQATPIYEACIDRLRQMVNGKIATGIFGANMQVSLINDGPVTIVIDSKQKE